MIQSVENKDYVNLATGHSSPLLITINPNIEKFFPLPTKDINTGEYSLYLQNFI